MMKSSRQTTFILSFIFLLNLTSASTSASDVSDLAKAKLSHDLLAKISALSQPEQSVGEVLLNTSVKNCPKVTAQLGAGIKTYLSRNQNTGDAIAYQPRIIRLSQACMIFSKILTPVILDSLDLEKVTNIRSSSCTAADRIGKIPCSLFLVSTSMTETDQVQIILRVASDADLPKLLKILEDLAVPVIDKTSRMILAKANTVQIQKLAIEPIIKVMGLD